jgi:hypothetical protein
LSSASSLGLFSDWERLSSKRDDILERQSLIFIRYRESYLGITKETKRTLRLPRTPDYRWRTQMMVWTDFGKILGLCLM